MTPGFREKSVDLTAAKRTVLIAATLIAVAAAGALGFRATTADGGRVLADTTIVPIAGGVFEPSGVAAVPGTNLLLFVDDGRSNEIFALELGADGKQVGNPTPIPLGTEVRDIEGITHDGRYFYLVGSQSKKTGHEGDGLLRFTFDPATRQVAGIERVRGLKAWLAANVPELAGAATKAGDDVLNIEGIAWDPVRSRFLLGLRAPQHDGNALIVPVKLADPTAGLSNDNLRFDGPSIRLSLGGSSIRSIEYDSVTAAFHVIAGASLNEEIADFRVYEWNGEPGGALRETATFPKELKPEGYTRAMIAGRPASVIVFDVGRLSVIY